MGASDSILQTPSGRHNAYLTQTETRMISADSDDHEQLIAQSTLLTLCPCLDVQDSEKCSDLQKDLLFGTFDCCTIGRKTVKEPTLLAGGPGVLFPSLPSKKEPGLRRGVSLRSTRSVVYRTSSTDTGLLKASQELKPTDEKQEQAKNAAQKMKRQSSRALSSASQKLTACSKSRADSGLTLASVNAKLLHAHVRAQNEFRIENLCAPELHGDCLFRSSAALFPSPHGRRQV